MPYFTNVLVCLLLTSVAIFADSEKGGRGVKVLDDAIFETKKPEPGADVVESVSGTRRYKGPASNTTTDKEAQWRDKCSISNERGSPGFGDCYRKEEGASGDAVNANKRTVQQRMGASVGPSIPLVEEIKKAPVFKEDSE